MLGALGTRAGLSQLCESSDEEEQEETQPGPRGRPPGKEEDDEDEEDGEDEEAQVDASDPSEADDVEGHWESESSSTEDGGVPEASEPSSEEEEEEAEVGCSQHRPASQSTSRNLNIKQSCIAAVKPRCLLSRWTMWSVVLVQNSRAQRPCVDLRGLPGPRDTC